MCAFSVFGLDAASLTEIQYLHIAPSEKGTYTNERMMLKSTWWAIENIYLLVFKLFEFSVEWIPAIRYKVEIIFSSKYHLGYLQLWIKK